LNFSQDELQRKLAVRQARLGAGIRRTIRGVQKRFGGGSSPGPRNSRTPSPTDDKPDNSKPSRPTSPAVAAPANGKKAAGGNALLGGFLPAGLLAGKKVPQGGVEANIPGGAPKAAAGGGNGKAAVNGKATPAALNGNDQLANDSNGRNAAAVGKVRELMNALGRK
jgi:hypothetical protein